MARVLIVDDEPAARLLVTTLLRHAGYEAVEASDGAAGLARAIEVSPDLMLVDLDLPVMSGTELIRAVRARSELADVTIALYTATAVTPALRDFMELCAIAHVIPKPSEPEAFLREVAAALGH